MHLVDPWANLSRWREHPVEVMTFSFGLLVLALVLPTVPCGPVILVTSALGIILGARIPLGVYLRIMVIPLTFLIFGSVALIFSVTTEGGWAVTVTDEGLRTAGIVVRRAVRASAAGEHQRRHKQDGDATPHSAPAPSSSSILGFGGAPARIWKNRSVRAQLNA